MNACHGTIPYVLTVLGQAPGCAQLRCESRDSRGERNSQGTCMYVQSEAGEEDLQRCLGQTPARASFSQVPVRHLNHGFGRRRGSAAILFEEP